MKNLFNEEVTDVPVKPTHGKFKKWKRENFYRKSTEYKKCGNCRFHIVENHHNKIYHKCVKMGLSHSEASDIRLSYVCGTWRKIGYLSPGSGSVQALNRMIRGNYGTGEFPGWSQGRLNPNRYPVCGRRER